MQLRVWAPEAKTVEVALAEGRFPLSPDGGGYWQADLAECEPGCRYQFVLDEGNPLPDPRSGFQPEGPHGPSQIVDHSSFQWSDEHWQAPPIESGILYELHLGTFTPEGTYLSTIERLDHLVDLGITHVELMPVNTFPGQRGWGYDGVNIFAPHPAYGQPDDLKRLVDACHAKGLAVILDVVYNHMGPDGNYLGQFGPYFNDRYHTPWGAAVNLDGAGSDEVRRFFIDNALMWLRDYHFDALRLDAIHALVDTSATHFLEQLREEIELLGITLGRHLTLIAESDLNDPRIVRSPLLGGYGIECQWMDDFHHALHSVLTGERNGYYADFGNLGHLAKSLRQGYVYDGCYSPHRGRSHGRPPEGLTAHAFLGYLQNHDQIGNRAQGDRVCHLVSLEQAKVGAALVLTAPFVPMLFQGEEWGASSPFLFFSDFQDEQLGKAVTAGRRKEFDGFGWKAEEIPDPQAEETFLRSRLNWDELGEDPHSSLLDWHRRLIQLRHTIPDLANGDFKRVDVNYDEAARWLIMQRGKVAVVSNFSDRPMAIAFECAGRKVLLQSSSEVHLEPMAVQMPPYSVVVIG